MAKELTHFYLFCILIANYLFCWNYGRLFAFGVYSFMEKYVLFCNIILDLNQLNANK